MREIIVAHQFRGPPNSGNGGFVCGLLGKEIAGPSTVALRALIPLDTPLNLESSKDAVRLLGREGTIIAEARRATSALPEPPIAPTLEQARAAGARCPVIEKPFHPPCFTCSSIREEGDGLRILPGQVEGAAAGEIACVWTPHQAFANSEGFIPQEIVWAALDCPGSLAWIVKTGMGGGLLGTMSAEVTTLPRAGQPTIVTAWPIEQSGRKFVAGVAMFDVEGRLIARGSQIWISLGPG